ncbi:hypothetical protein JL107_12795 [Nakamurella flavida]|uniref:HTTM-like domain-containing protein n=1 Tax=Nakamurella flavida TaxID=363630 RepID=A0A938YLE6_9ACTN|nr:hypothetical protein [Nakamurella flavida]MBM9477324.1 hypothetical protein [Nakamurella flavida]MDP9779780.1 hypothetical protein [Nakamurella flavida]
MKALARFDAWVLRGPFTPRDLGRFRIVFCLLLVLLVPQLDWLAPYPNSFYEPPWGPFALLSGFPSAPVLTVVEIVVFLSLAATLLGLFTTASSIALTLSLVVDFGLNFSVGKVDHSMVMVMVPAVLAFARWGDTCSLDAIRRRRRGLDPVDADTARARLQWPMRFLGLAIGLAFVSAAAPKVLGGWLSLSSQASYGYQVRSDVLSGRSSLLSSFLVDLHVPAVWEALDWATVALEAGVVLCLVTWRSWRIGLAVLALFHVGIGLSLGIWFASNVMAYGAFVAWGRWALPSVTLSERTRRTVSRAAIPLTVGVGLLLWWVSGLISPAIETFRMLIVLAGAAVALVYLLAQVRGLLTRRRGRVPETLHSTSPAG